MQTKIELLKYLVGSGKITLDQALVLAAGQDNSLNEPIGFELSKGSIPALKDKKEENLKEFISSIVDKHYEHDESDNQDYLVSFDIDKCVKLMEFNNHTWWNSVTGKDEKVDADRLRNELRRMIKKCVEEFIERNQDGEHEDYWSIDERGFIVECWWSDEDKTKIEVEVMYVPIRNSNTIEINKIS